MGTNQPFEADTRWSRAAELLDGTFPLADGSHAAAIDYLVHFGHLLVVRADGSCTGLARPGQFVGSDDDDGCACRAVLLEHDGLQVEIEPSGRRPAMAGDACEHRLQLLTSISPA